ncbi:MAG TPA: hypothetical protein VHS30_09000, partial [Streptosporangiaceae bacterium]|nr:hypothetical protein [Streptosporangiaceae bacterium]
TEVRTTAGIAAGVVEVAAFAVLAALAARPRPSGRPWRPRASRGPATAWLDAGAPGAAAAADGVSALAWCCSAWGSRARARPPPRS